MGIFTQLSFFFFFSSFNVLLSESNDIKYPIEASWFADRYTLIDWRKVLDQFTSIGGNTIWQRGRILRMISSDDLQSHHDYQWCFIHGIHCVQQVQTDAKDLGVKEIKNFLIYDYEENYGKDILICSFDRIVYSSRIYHILIVPHDNFDEKFDKTCDIHNKNVDVVFISYSGIDSKEILFEESTNYVNPELEIYISGPYLPVKVKEAYLINPNLLPACFELTKRIYKSYKRRFGHYKAFKGIYQAMETSMAQEKMDEHILQAYEVQYKMTHEILNKKFVLSPYVNSNRNMLSFSSVKIHSDNFERLTYLCDVIAVQEGRGCGKNSFFEDFQKNTPIIEVDPKLNEIVHYLEDIHDIPKMEKKVQDYTFEEKFFFSSEDMFKEFAERIKKRGEKAPEFWLNIEAFEYVREHPCLPLDKFGNGMAELLERSNKQRIDFSLTTESFYVNRIITFAWDYNYQCVPKGSGYSKSIYEEIIDDYDRPIINQIQISNETNKDISIFGYNIAEMNVEFEFFWNEKSVNVKPYKVDEKWGERNKKSYLMGEAVVKFIKELPEHTPIEVYAFVNGKKSFHPKYFYNSNTK